MCGRVILLSFEELQSVLGDLRTGKSPAAVLPASKDRQLSFDAALHARQQARCGGDVQALVAARRSVASELDICSLRWGFTAPWNGKLVFNTRLESIMKPQSFWEDIARDGRCVLPVVAFFETHRSETVKSPKTGRQIKSAYAFASPQGYPLLLASVHDDERLSVVPTQPNDDIEAVHNRMPLVLRHDEIDTWLEGDYATLADRSAFRLASAPEFDSTPDNSVEQQSLF